MRWLLCTSFDTSFSFEQDKLYVFLKTLVYSLDFDQDYLSSVTIKKEGKFCALSEDARLIIKARHYLD